MEGNSFLRGREFYTWDSKHKKDFVTIAHTERDETSFSRWLNPALLRLYHKAWGGRGTVSLLSGLYCKMVDQLIGFLASQDGGHRERPSHRL